MKTEKIFLIILVVLLLLIAAGAAWITMNCHIVDFKLYPKNAQVLDLRGENISVSHYEALKKAMPECKILWDEPAQDSGVSGNSEKSDIQEEEETNPIITEDTDPTVTEETQIQVVDEDGNITVLGKAFPQDAVEVDLTDIIARDVGEAEGTKSAYQYGLEFRVMSYQEENPSAAKVLEDHPFPDKTAQTETLIAEVEAAMAHFPNAEKLVMCGAWLDNEQMAQFRERHREEYNVVWSVQCGDIAPRTDATFFMPTKYYVEMGKFTDEHSYNLRYCEDMVCMDFGHMNIMNLDFVAFMPELKYLVITLTPVYDLSPLANCKKLVFLEMDWSFVTDYSPLLECTALEDLNIGETYGKIDPILEMTWLKNLWLVGMKESYYEQAVAALPDTNIGYRYGNPDDGWRELPNYFAMRDELKMFYME